MASLLSGFSQELHSLAETSGASVVAVHGRHRLPSSGVVWRKDIIVTADHTIRKDGEITIVVDGGKRVSAKLAGRDSSTDVAILKVEEANLKPAQTGDSSPLKLANFVLALGRSRRGNLVASAGIVGGLSGEWRTWRGGKIEQNIRLDLNLYPGFSGGPLVSVEGKVIGINTNGFGRGRAVTIPAATVNRISQELIDKGYIARPYLGIAMQPVALSERLRGKLRSEATGGLMVIHVEPNGPADKAAMVLGDVIVELGGKPALETGHLHDLLASSKVGDSLQVKALRGGAPVEFSVTLGERAR